MRASSQLVKIILPAAILIIAALGLAWLALVPRLTSTRTATLSELVNDVQSCPAAEKDWEPATEGQVIRAGGGVRTGVDARARVDISDGAILRMAANSEFELKELSGTASDPVTRLTLAAGKLWTALGGGTFEIETPAGSATVRGSFMSVELTTAAEMVITCLEGECRLTGASGAFTDLSGGQQAAIPGVGQDPSPAKPMDPEQYEDWAENFPEAPVPTATPVPTTSSVTTMTPEPTITPRPTDTPIGVSMWVDVWCWLQGPAGDPASRNPQTGFDAVVQGRDAVRDVAQIVVESPSGEIVVLQPYGDIPYGSEGRFAGMTQGLPQAGGTYTFTALNADGAPIPGAVDFDLYVGGNEPDPPTNVQAEVVEAGILITWDPSPVIPGAFEPNGSPPFGFYSIYLKQEDGNLLYGWGGSPMPGPSHLIPFRRQDFGPGDAGLALEEMDDGVYYLEMHTFSEEPKSRAGQHAECIAHDPAQNIRLVIEGGQVRVEAP
jgi:hypothetical protein